MSILFRAEMATEVNRIARSKREKNTQTHTHKTNLIQQTRKLFTDNIFLFATLLNCEPLSISTHMRVSKAATKQGSKSGFFFSFLFFKIIQLFLLDTFNMFALTATSTRGTKHHQKLISTECVMSVRTSVTLAMQILGWFFLSFFFSFFMQCMCVQQAAYEHKQIYLHFHKMHLMRNDDNDGGQNCCVSYSISM